MHESYRLLRLCRLWLTCISANPPASQIWSPTHLRQPQLGTRVKCLFTHFESQRESHRNRSHSTLTYEFVPNLLARRLSIQYSCRQWLLKAKKDTSQGAHHSRNISSKSSDSRWLFIWNIWQFNASGKCHLKKSQQFLNSHLLGCKNIARPLLLLVRFIGHKTAHGFNAVNRVRSWWIRVAYFYSLTAQLAVSSPLISWLIVRESKRSLGDYYNIQPFRKLFTFTHLTNKPEYVLQNGISRDSQRRNRQVNRNIRSVSAQFENTINTYRSNTRLWQVTISYVSNPNSGYQLDSFRMVGRKDALGN